MTENMVGIITLGIVFISLIWISAWVIDKQDQRKHEKWLNESKDIDD
jgi:hypothetical protein